MPRFKGYLRRLITQTEEGFHGWDEIHICFSQSMQLFFIQCKENISMHANQAPAIKNE